MTTGNPFRGRLGIARAGYSAILTAGSFAVAVGVAVTWFSPCLWPWLALPPMALLAFVTYFFRDPERSCIDDPAFLVAPADGVVDDIARASSCEGVETDGSPFVRIGIYLSLFSVHVQRAPCAGRVQSSFAVAGARVPTRRVGATDGNERHVTVIVPGVGSSARCTIRQIAGPIARGIVNVARPGETLVAGQRIGLIRFGSRVEIFVSASIVEALQVRIGSTVRAGLTPLALLRLANESTRADVVAANLTHPRENP